MNYVNDESTISILQTTALSEIRLITGTSVFNIITYFHLHVEDVLKSDINYNSGKTTTKTQIHHQKKPHHPENNNNSTPKKTTTTTNKQKTKKQLNACYISKLQARTFYFRLVIKRELLSLLLFSFGQLNILEFDTIRTLPLK